MAEKGVIFSTKKSRKEGGVPMEKMMATQSVGDPPNEYSIFDEPITTSTCPTPTWKVYDGPLYYSQMRRPRSHRLHLPISSRNYKLDASLWDFPLVMAPDLDLARAQIMELKAELELERKARKKLESSNRKLGRELCEEARGREALERACEELAREISSDKAEINRLRREMEEERKMLRVAEVLREERVQMKLADARLLLEEKMLELEATIKLQRIMQPDRSPAPDRTHYSNNQYQDGNHINGQHPSPAHAPLSLEEPLTRVLADDVKLSPACGADIGNGLVHSAWLHRRARASPEPENPHIKRGIKGFVEFPKVVRAIGSKSRHSGAKLECQWAQIRTLLKQRGPVSSNNFLVS